MDDIGNGPAKPLRRHLLPLQGVTRPVDQGGGADLTRSHGQGNGVRTHGIYFAIFSLATLVLLIVAIAVASTNM